MPTPAGDPVDIASAPSYVRPGHPRERGVWPQYFGLTTRLRGRVFYSDYITDNDAWQLADGAQAEMLDLSIQTPENYHDTHNHYQTILSEVLNFAPHVNAVPIWGDGSAIAHDSSAWGAFVSARSHFPGPDDPLRAYLPQSTATIDRDSFDCQLCGLEVDVLNAGKPGVYPNKAKHGVQVVGFGNPNSHALSVICENFDCEPEKRRGQFEAGLYFQNSIHPTYGRTLVADFDQAQIGLDFRKPVFSFGAVQVNAPNPGSGILFSEGRGGELYAGTRWPGQDTPQWLTIRLGQEGVRIVSNDGAREIVAIDAYGGIYLNGDLFLNGRKVTMETATPPGETSIARAFGLLVEALAGAVRRLGQRARRPR